MIRGILIAGNESSLSAAVAAEAAKRVECFAAALIPSGLDGADYVPPRRPPAKTPRTAGKAARGDASPVPAGQPANSAKGRIVLDWNPGSPISARSLALAAENHLEHIDEAVLVCVPPAARKRAEELTPAEIETLVNGHIKGWFFLARELIIRFKQRQRGILSLVLSDFGSGARDEAVDLLGPPAIASFRAFAQGLLAASFNESYQVLAFSSAEIGEDSGFASFIFKIMEENKRAAGKWHKYGRLGFFGR